MKILGAILIAVLFVHLQCGGSCLAASSKPPVSTDPPCHKQSGTPADSSQQNHETGNRCSQGSVTEAKAAGCGKHVLQVVAVVAPVAAAATLDAISRPVYLQSPPNISSQSSAVFVLRI